MNKYLLSLLAFLPKCLNTLDGLISLSLLFRPNTISNHVLIFSLLLPLPTSIYISPFSPLFPFFSSGILYIVVANHDTGSPSMYHDLAYLHKVMPRCRSGALSPALILSTGQHGESQKSYFWVPFGSQAGPHNS